MFEQTFKNIDDMRHKDAGRTRALDYTEQPSWLLFLKYQNGGDEVALQTPAEILDEIAGLGA